MKIVFIVPTTGLKRFPPYRWAGRIYGQPNSITGPLILGGILKRAGHEVEVYEELNGKVPYNRLLKDTDIFCFSLMTSNAPRGYEQADMIHRRSGARVLMGGMHPTWMPEEALEHADQIIIGEGEKVILDVVEGRITEPVVRGPLIENIDEVPFPDYSILKTPCAAANVISTRGCPCRCSFCTTSRMFHPYRKRSVDNVIAEIRRYKEMGFRYMNFEDDNFTADKERAKEICRAGEACKRHRIRVIASIVLGLDEDGLSDMDRSIAFAEFIHAYQLQPAILTPFPGTPVYRDYEAQGRILPGSWSRFDMMNVVFQPAKMSPWELQEEFFRACREFYTFSSAKDIRRIFGKEYGRRRWGLALMTRLGTGAARLASHIAPHSDYYTLRHISDAQ